MELRNILLSGKSPSFTPIPKSILRLPVDTSKPPQTILRKEPNKECSITNVIDGDMTPAVNSSAIPTIDPVEPPVILVIQDDVTSLPEDVTAALKDVVSVTNDPSSHHAVVHSITDTLVSCAPLVGRDTESSDHIIPVAVGTISVSPIANAVTRTDDDVTIGSPHDCTVPDVNKDQSTSVPCKNATPPSPKLFTLSPTWHTKIPVNKCKKRPAQSPLMGKFLSGRRRLNTPVSKFQARNLFPGNDSDSCLDSDDDSICWDRDSIASEILICEDFEGVVANNSDI